MKISFFNNVIFEHIPKKIKNEMHTMYIIKEKNSYLIKIYYYKNGEYINLNFIVNKQEQLFTYLEKATNIWGLSYVEDYPNDYIDFIIEKINQYNTFDIQLSFK